VSWGAALKIDVTPPLQNNTGQAGLESAPELCRAAQLKG